MEKSKLERISELTRISRERALTEAEQEERTMLRRQYADEMCGSLKATLDHTWVVDGQGNRYPQKAASRISGVWTGFTASSGSTRLKPS